MSTKRTHAIPRVSLTVQRITAQIADLEAKRTAIYAGAAGHHLTEIEREQLRAIAGALSAAWELRRIEQAQSEPVDHELIVVSQLKERTV